MQIWALAPCGELSAVSLFSDGMLYSAAFSFCRVDLLVLRSPF